jgi:hypothetical protein
MCEDPNLVITAVCAFPNIEDTIEKCNKYYEIEELNNDPIYKEMTTYLNYLSMGRDFTPIAFADRIPKLEKLQKLQPVDKSYFWCVGYVTPYLVGNNRALLKPSRSLNQPTYETFLMWLEHRVKNYDDSTSSTYNCSLFENALRDYIREKSDGIVNDNRRFNLIYNNRTVISNKRDMTINDWIDHLKNLPNRDIYEIMVNDFI